MKKVKLFNEFAEPTNEDCWDGYTKDGMKTKGGKQVPNCVPTSENEVTEANADGTISDDEDQRRDELEMEVYQEAKAFAEDVIARSYDIGGNFRGPGIQADMAKQIKKAFKDAKIRI